VRNRLCNRKPARQIQFLDRQWVQLPERSIAGVRLKGSVSKPEANKDPKQEAREQRRNVVLQSQSQCHKTGLRYKRDKSFVTDTIYLCIIVRR
jgi:hypothetical protein